MASAGQTSGDWISSEVVESQRFRSGCWRILVQYSMTSAVVPIRFSGSVSPFSPSTHTEIPLPRARPTGIFCLAFAAAVFINLRTTSAVIGATKARE